MPCYKWAVLLLAAAVLLLGGAALFRAALLTVSEVEAWARAHALVLTAQNRPMVAWYLRTASLLRTLGVLAGLALPTMAAIVLGHRTVSVGSWPYLFVGYLLGALYAEVALVRPSEGRVLLVPRRLGDYLPTRLLVAQRALGFVVVLGALGALATVSQSTFGPGQLSLVVAAGAGVGVLALEVVQRWIVRRPQPMGSPSLVAADDAIRSQSVHSVAGSGLALGLVALAAVGAYLAQSQVLVLRRFLTVPTLLLPVLAIAVCLFYGHRRWRVTRFDRRAEAATTC